MKLFSIPRSSLKVLQGARARVALGLIFAGLVLIPTVGQAAVDLDELVADGQLRASVSIDTKGELYQRAPFILSVEIATARWFSRGTRVRDFRIPGALVRPVSTFADNSSRRIAGQTWSVQRWRFRVFPQDAGLLAVPELAVFISVNTETDGTVEGELVLDAAPAQIIPPPGVENVSTWIATPSLTIEQRWEGLGDSYMAGDAITRLRSYLVKDAPGMMLEASPVEDIAGLSLYQAPAKVIDQSHRGTLTGRREESLIITFEAPGQYQIPGLDYVWFNTQTGTLETLSLPALEVVVVANAAVAAPPQNKRIEPSVASRVILGSGITLIIALLLWTTRNTPRSRKLRKTLHSRLEKRRSYAFYLQALQQKNSAHCIQLLYQQLTQAGSQRQLITALRALKTPGRRTTNAAVIQHPEQTLRQLLEHAYGEGSKLPGRQDARELWSAVSQYSRDTEKAARLQLNPLCC